MANLEINKRPTSPRHTQRNDNWVEIWQIISTNTRTFYNDLPLLIVTDEQRLSGMILNTRQKIEYPGNSLGMLGWVCSRYNSGFEFMPS